VVAAGETEEARRMVTTAIAGWSRAGFHSPHFTELYRQTEIDFYQGDAATALARMTTAWPTLKQSHYLRNQFARIEVTHLRARARIASRAAARRLLDDVLRDAARIEREQTRWGDAFATLLRAGVAAARGDGDRALEYLQHAEGLLERSEMGLYLAVTRFHRGRVLGGADGQALVAEGRATMLAQGIADPETYARVLVPGFEAFRLHG
jgi:ATP/maltotriose-dependent transcriptional regulator MalT